MSEELTARQCFAWSFALMSLAIICAFVAISDESLTFMFLSGMLFDMAFAACYDGLKEIERH